MIDLPKTTRKAIVASFREASEDGAKVIPYNVAVSLAGRHEVAFTLLRAFAEERGFEVADGNAPLAHKIIAEPKRAPCIPDRIPEAVLRSLERGGIYRMLTDDPDSFVLTTRSQWNRERAVIARLVARYRADLAKELEEAKP